MEELRMEDDQIITQAVDGIEERVKEELHLEHCLKVIQKNIDDYTFKLKESNAETKELYDNYRSNNPELHNELVVGLDLQSQMVRTRNKNLLALKKPYFGRIDYLEKGDEKNFSLYLGKNGISKNNSEILIIDWRAPISSVYYDSDIGESSYKSPFDDEILITLNLKRTFEISDSKLIDYYDTDVIANDEFLTKYLSKNKEVVLGEIIATIQKEQNQIIRDTPWHSVIVQGVAGSGKTTVAMHRISYILYNYKDKFRSDEFYIIGSNKMLLNYITGVLPNLDVYNINQLVMEEFFLTLLGSDFNIKRGKYKLSNSFTKLSPITQSERSTALKRYKGSIYFIKALEQYLEQYELDHITTEPFLYRGKVLYSKEEIKSFLSIFSAKPLLEKIDLLNKRLASKIRLSNEKSNEDKEVIKVELQKYKEYFGKKNIKIDLMEVYKNFLRHLQDHHKEYDQPIPEKEVLGLLIDNLNDKTIDLYDIGMLTLLKRRLKITPDFEYVRHIIVDEAQDFGVLIYYALKQLFQNCTYTIMGDVSQNIHYDTGMNDWETLKTEVFQQEKDKFYVLAKSYRNTVEISDYASKVLKHCTFKTYDIEPIIRHGKEVAVIQLVNEKEMILRTVQIIEDNQKEGYSTIAVICRTVEESIKVQKLLGTYITIQQPEGMEEMTFTDGVMVLPIHMTKGLEFDSVILWNPDEVRYQASDADAKLLYVAITRALHELSIVYLGNLAKLLK